MPCLRTLKYGLILITMFLFFFSRVIHYRLKFLTSDRFDNRFITSDFLEIDLQRAKHDLETVLPLNRREKRHYVRVIFTGIIIFLFL
jgi:hypothetical protein